MVRLAIDGDFVARERRRGDLHVDEDPLLLVATPGERDARSLAHPAVGAVAAAQVPRSHLLELPIGMPERARHPVGVPLEADELDFSLYRAAERP
jgi:hypothetical protein